MHSKSYPLCMYFSRQQWRSFLNSASFLEAITLQTAKKKKHRTANISSHVEDETHDPYTHTHTYILYSPHINDICIREWGSIAEMPLSFAVFVLFARSRSRDVSAKHDLMGFRFDTRLMHSPRTLLVLFKCFCWIWWRLYKEWFLF